MADAPKALEGEVLEDGTEVPRSHDVTPGWISRNRRTIDRVRTASRAVMIVAPPPIRIPLALASLAADAALLAEDVRRRQEERSTGGLKGVALALEGAAMLAASRYAPLRLAANIGAIEAARRVTERLIKERATP